MKTKRKPEVFFTETSPEKSLETSKPESPKPVDTVSKARIAIPINEDGTIDLGMMREATKEKLRQAIHSTPLLIPEQAKSAEVTVFHPAMVSGMYDLLGSLEAAAAQRVLAIPEPIAKQIFLYTPAEKNALSGPTVRVLNKYAAEWMIRYQDEIALATLLISMTVTKVNAAMLLAKMQKAGNTVQPASQAKSEEKDEKGEGPTPIPN